MRKWVFALVVVRNTKVIIPIVPAEFSSLLFCRLGYCCIHYFNNNNNKKETFWNFRPAQRAVLHLQPFSFREQIGCPLSSERPGSFGEFRHHSGTFQKLQETGSGLELLLSAAPQQLPSAAAFAVSALAVVLGPATPTCRGPDGLSPPPSRGLPVPGAAAGRLAAEKPGSSVSSQRRFFLLSTYLRVSFLLKKTTTKKQVSIPNDLESHIYTGRTNHRRQDTVTAQSLKILSVQSVKLLLRILRVFL